MQTPLVSIFDLYLLTPGRRLYVFAELRARASALDIEALVPLIDAAIAHDKQVLDLDAERRGGGSEESVRDKDRAVDRTLSTIHTLLSHYAAVESGAASELLSELLPEGLGAHTRLNFVEQAAANERVLSVLAADHHQAWLDARGLTLLAKQLAGEHARFIAALEGRDKQSAPSYAAVKAANQAGQARYLEVIASIITHSVDAPERRAALLEPALLQEQQVGALRRQRRKPGEVDPISGEPLEASAPPLLDVG